MKIPKTVDVCGLRYTVVFVPAGARGPKQWTKRMEGMLDIDAARIYLAARLRRNPTRLRDAFMHELAHAISEGTGIRHWLAKLVPGKKRRSDRVWELEEDVVRIVTPALIMALDSAGLI